MLIALHKNATTTPATRLALQQASGTDRELAQQYGIGVGTVRKWRTRSTVQDASHTAHRLQPDSRRRRRNWSSVCAPNCCCRSMTCLRW